MRDSYIFYTDRLKGEYRDVFGQIEMYVLSRFGDEETREERMGELLDIFLNAQQSGRPPESVTGQDLERFCENFCGDYGAGKTLLFLADWICGIAWLFLLESLVDMVCFFAETGTGFYPGILHMPRAEHMLGYFMGFVISVIIAWAAKAFTRRVMFRAGRVPLRWLRILSGAAVVLSFAAAFALVSAEWAAGFSCPQLVIFLAAGSYLVCYYLLRKKKKAEKIRFSDFVVEELEKVVPEDLEKRFQKENGKRKEQGKSGITFEAFLEEEEKRYRRWDRFYGLGMAVFILSGLAVSLVGTYLTGGFDGGWDMALFAAIVLVCECVIFFGLRKLTRADVTAREKWIQSYRRGQAEEREK